MDVEVVTRDDVRDVVCGIVLVAAAAVALDVCFWGPFYELTQEGMGWPVWGALL